jgi:glucose/arabinose dehydrogenase
MRRRTTGLLGVWICALLVCPLGRAQPPAAPQAPRTDAEVLEALAQGAPLPVQLPADARQSPALPGPSLATAAPQAKKIHFLPSSRLLFWLNI